MSRFDKLLQRIRDLDKDMRFEELRKVLEYYGYTMSSPSGGSSHRVFRKAGALPITIPKNEPIKRAYVALVRDIVESEAKNEKNNRLLS